MTPRERVIKALRFEKPDRVPRHLWRLPGTKMFRQDDVDRVLAKYPEDITILDFAYGKGKLTRGERYRKDQEATDEWGCTWRAAEDGVTGEVKEPPLGSISDMRSLMVPSSTRSTAAASRRIHLLLDGRRSGLSRGCSSCWGQRSYLWS